MAAFNQAGKKGDVFDEGHKAQIDALKTIAQEITAEGTFTVEIEKLDFLPILSIERNADKKEISFFIDFGFNAFGGSATTKLSYSLAKIPVGDKKDGYSLQYASDRASFLKDFGKAVAERFDYVERAEKTVSYAKGTKPAA